MHAFKPHFSAQLGKYRHLAKKVSRLLKDGSFQLLTKHEQRLLLAKLKARLKRIGHLMPSPQLKGAFAGIALLMGTAAGTVQAQNFAPGVNSPFGILPSMTALGYQAFADIDGDGDLDLLLNTYDYGAGSYSFYFFENTGTAQSPAFSSDNSLVNPYGLQPGYLSQPMLIDLDNDGDLDLISGSLYGGGFIYQENIGSATAPNYAAQVTDPFGLSNSQNFDFATAADLDGDGDLDILGGGFYGSLNFFENIGTPESPSFAAPQADPFGIATEGLLITIPHLCDMDNDGDLDILAFNFNYYFPSQMVFLENTGTATAPTFAPAVTDPFGITTNGAYVAFPSCADIDADGDQDVFINDYNGTGIVFYENLNIDLAYPPTSADNVVNMDEDGTYIFGQDDFPFSDNDLTDQLQAIQIVSLPSSGQLKLGSTAVNMNDVIGVANLANLNYKPAQNESGNNYTSFGFKVYDGTLYSVDANTISFNVAPVNDAPTSQDAEVTASNDFDFIFEAADFPYSDVENDAIAAVKITSLPDKGTLKFNGNAVVLNQSIPIANIGNLTYRSLAGETGVPYTNFQFQVSDGSAFSTNTVMRINVAETLATSDNKLEVQLSLSPNPVENVLNIKATASQNMDNPTIQVLDVNGQMIQVINISAASQSFDYQLDVSTLSAGVYLVRIESNGTIGTMRFVKS